MVVKAEQERVKHLLSQALPMLCKNGLSFDSEFSIEALIGITLDKNDVFLVSIKETVNATEGDGKTLDVNVTKVANDAVDSLNMSPKSKSPRKRRRSRTSKPRDSESETEVEMADDHTTIKREKIEEPELMNNVEESDPSLKPEQDFMNSSQATNENSMENITVKTEPPDVGFDSSFGNISQVSNAPDFDISATAYSTPSQHVQPDINTHASTSQHDQSFSPTLTSNVSRQDSNGQASDTQNSTKIIDGKDGQEVSGLRAENVPNIDTDCLLHEKGIGWRCVFCGKLSTLKRSLKVHILAQHLRIQHDCACGKKFRLSALFEEHKKTCTVFQRGFKRRNKNNR